MTTESSAMYTSSLLAPSTSAPLANPASVSTPTPPSATNPPSAPLPHTASPTNNTVAAAASAAAAVAAAQAQAAVNADTKPALSTAQQTPNPAQVPTAQMPQMAAAFQPYAPGMVFATPDPTVIEDQPTYVNPKQYARILKRRESRKKQTGTDVTSYTPRKRSYMHESRHKHAMQRRRGPGGRFLSKEEREEMGRAQMKETPAVGQ